MISGDNGEESGEAQSFRAESVTAKILKDAQLHGIPVSGHTGRNRNPRQPCV